MSMLINAVRFFSYQVHEFLQDAPQIGITDVYEFGHNWTLFIPQHCNFTDHIMYSSVFVQAWMCIIIVGNSYLKLTVHWRSCNKRNCNSRTNIDFKIRCCPMCRKELWQNLRCRNMTKPLSRMGKDIYIGDIIYTIFS